MPDSILPTNAGDLLLDSFRYFMYYRLSLMIANFFFGHEYSPKIAAFVPGKYRLKHHNNVLKLLSKNSGKSRKNKEQNSLELLLHNILYVCGHLHKVIFVSTIFWAFPQ